MSHSIDHFFCFLFPAAAFLAGFFLLAFLALLLGVAAFWGVAAAGASAGAAALGFLALTAFFVFLAPAVFLIFFDPAAFLVLLTTLFAGAVLAIKTINNLVFCRLKSLHMLAIQNFWKDEYCKDESKYPPVSIIDIANAKFQIAEVNWDLPIVMIEFD